MEKIKNGIGILITGILAVMLASCNSYLEELPDNRVELNTLDKAAQLLVSGYSIAGYNFTEWMTDNVGFTNGVSLRTNCIQAYAWEEFTDGAVTQDTPDYYWSQGYNAIAHANEVIAVIDDLPANGEQELARRNAIKAEALLIRAYNHFMLVNLFAEHFDEDDADTDPGVPYVLQPETKFIQQYSRASVEQVYDRVEQDMLAGLELMDDSFFLGSGKYHFNRNAALAFASRFYLFKGDYRESLEFSNELLSGSAGSLIRDLTSPEFQNAKSSIDAYPQLYTSPELPSNLLLIRKNSLLQIPSIGHGPTFTIYNDLFGQNPFPGSTDERENPAFVKGTNAVLPVRYQTLFQRSSLNASSGFPYHIFIAFSGEEVLFNRMEALIQLNRTTEALNDMQVLVERRYSLPGGQTPQLTLQVLREFFGVVNNPNVSDQLVLAVYIQIERQKEFIWQGLRWFDLKRFEIPVEHDFPDGTVITLEEDDPRKVLQIPTIAQEVGGLQPNPR